MWMVSVASCKSCCFLQHFLRIQRNSSSWICFFHGCSQLLYLTHRHQHHNRLTMVRGKQNIETSKFIKVWHMKCLKFLWHKNILTALSSHTKNQMLACCWIRTLPFYQESSNCTSVWNLSLKGVRSKSSLPAGLLCALVVLFLSILIREQHISINIFINIWYD